MTSSISSLTSSLYSTSTLSAGAGSATGSSQRKSLIETAADALGMSTDDVTSALSNGSSLADLAKTAGVSEDDLVSDLEANAPDDLKSNSNLESMTKKLVETQGLTDPSTQSSSSGSSSTTGVLSGNPTASQSSTVDLLSSMLGTDSDSLISSLSTGSSLSDLASSSGVSYDQLASVLQSSLSSTGLLVDTSL